MMIRIVELENQIGAGLIEEVIQVAEGELKLVEIVAESKPYVCSFFPSLPSLILPPQTLPLHSISYTVLFSLFPVSLLGTQCHETNTSTRWEPLEEKPPEGQWTYFDRGQNTGAT